MYCIRPLSLLSLFVLTAFSSIWSQECNPVSFFIQNTSETIESVSVDYDLMGNSENGDVFSTGSWSVNATEATWVEFCMPAGCYTLLISGESVNPQTIAMELMQSDFIQIVEFYSEEEGIWMFPFCVENAPVFDCPEAIYFEAGEGCTWAFEIGSFQEGENVVWNFGDGQESVEGGHFNVHDFPNTGTYEVTAFFTSFDCPMGVYLTTSIVVEGCGEEECTLEMDVSSADGMWYTFEIPEQPEGALIEWYIDGQVIPPTSENGLTFEAGFDFNPNWSVCVEVFTDACPDGMEACYTNMESSDCPNPDVMEVEYLGGCHALFWLYDENIWEIGWSVNGELIEWNTGIYFDYEFPSNGEYVVTAELYSATCQGEVYTWELTIEGCDEECDIEAVAYPLECNDFLVEALNFPEGAQLFWTLDGEPYEVNTAEFFYTAPDDDCHVFSVGYETEYCPNGAFDEVEVCPDCGDEGCEVSIVWEALSDGVYLFSAVDSEGALWEGTVDWWTTGENVGTGNPFAWTWDNEEVSVESMCIGFSDWEDCDGGETCVVLETAPIACEEVQFALNAEWSDEGFWTFQLLLDATIADWEVQGWSLNLNWEEFGSVSDTVTACIPAACFDVAATFEFPLGGGLESFVIQALLDDATSLVLVDIQNGVYNDFGLLPDCSLDSGLEEGMGLPSLVHVWPNPAINTVNWTLPSETFNGDIRAHSLDGKLIHQEAIQGIEGALEVNGWPAGFYTISWVEKGLPAYRSRVLVAD